MQNAETEYERRRPYAHEKNERQGAVDTEECLTPALRGHAVHYLRPAYPGIPVKKTCEPELSRYTPGGNNRFIPIPEHKQDNNDSGHYRDYSDIEPPRKFSEKFYEDSRSLSREG